MDSQAFWIIVGAGILALVYAIFAYGKIKAFKVDHERVNELSEIIHRGADRKSVV